jgi:hypothetical protein
MEPTFEQEHPIPQQISAYEFHLVGDMTLKQFFQVAFGALIALVFYSSALPTYVKWPGIAISFLGGVAFAFFPLQNRPLAVWIGLFLKAIYSPTAYYWSKTTKKRQFFQPESAQAHAIPEPEPVDNLEALQKMPKPIPVFAPQATQQQTRDVVQETQPVVSPALTPAPKPEAPLAKGPEKKREVEIPKTEDVSVEKQAKPEQTEAETQKQKITTTNITPSMGQKFYQSVQAQFSPDASPPTPPNKPNVIVGQVMDSEGGIIEGAILEVKDDDGRSVRALKTNKLGHFMIVTPLLDGKYKIVTEKEGYNFDVVNFKADGKIIQPIAIRAKSESQNQEQSKQN